MQFWVFLLQNVMLNSVCYFPIFYFKHMFLFIILYNFYTIIDLTILLHFLFELLFY